MNALNANRSGLELDLILKIWAEFLRLSQNLGGGFLYSSRNKSNLEPTSQAMLALGKGGEPFLRPDLPEIVDIICEESSPAILNIPTSGTTHSHIFKFLPGILESTRGRQFTLNFSLDEIGEKHDQIRRTPRNWEKTLEAMRFARSLQPAHPHFTIGIHTVISVYNVDRLPAIYEELQKLDPDSYITEVAEERAELMTLGSGITPPPDKYAETVDFLASRMRAKRRPGFASIIDGFRLEYYRLVKRILVEKRQVIPCYAGVTSCHIAADGDVWGCCVRAEPLGNLREAGYDFASIWRGPSARAFRRSVKNNECHCPLANASYTNMLLDPGTLGRVGWNLLFPGRNGARLRKPAAAPAALQGL